MRYGEDYWTPAEAENGLAPHTVVYDLASGVYREIIDDDEDERSLPHSPLRSERKVRALTAEQLGRTDEEEGAE
jgi:hypothetical protein